jgi:hypothetical protein
MKFRPRYSIQSLMAVSSVVAIVLAFAVKMGFGLAANDFLWATLWTAVLWLIAFANPETRGRIQFIWLLLAVISIVAVSGLLAIATQPIDVARLRLPPRNTETETFQSFVFVGTACGLLIGSLAGLCCIRPIGVAPADTTSQRLFWQISQFPDKITFARSCILATFMTFIGIGVGVVVTAFFWLFDDVHPADKWVLLDVYGKIGGMGGFVGGWGWCGMLAMRQLRRGSRVPDVALPVDNDEVD